MGQTDRAACIWMMTEDAQILTLPPPGKIAAFRLSLIATLSLDSNSGLAPESRGGRGRREFLSSVLGQ